MHDWKHTTSEPVRALTKTPRTATESSSTPKNSVNADPGDRDFAIVDLPEIEQAATIVHRGAMDNVMPTVQSLARWIDASGYRLVSYNRKLYIELGENRDAWMRELQEPIVMR